MDEIKKNYTWPDPDWLDYEGIPSQAERLAGHPIRGGGSEPFLTYKDLRGQEQAMLDLIENPEIVQYCLDHCSSCLIRILYASWKPSQAELI